MALLLPYSCACTSGSTVSSWHVESFQGQPGTALVHLQQEWPDPVAHGSGLLLLLDLHHLLCIFGVSLTSGGVWQQISDTHLALALQDELLAATGGYVCTL